MSKFEPLLQWLRQQSEPDVQVPFAELETVLGYPLPDSARRYPAYWAAGGNAGRTLALDGWRASLRDIGVMFRRLDTPSLDQRAPALPGSQTRIDVPDLVLIGCVKTQRAGRHRARDLYASTLFAGRAAHAAATGAPWMILSARYGLVDPDAELDNYDVALRELSPAAHDAWGRMVLAQFDERFPHPTDMVVEVHAGAEYRSGVLRVGLIERGVRLVAPLARLGIGQQLGWYAERYGPAHPGARRHHTGTAADVRTTTTASAPEAFEPMDREALEHLVADLSRDFHERRLDLSARPGFPAQGWAAMPEFRTDAAVRALGASDLERRLVLTLGAVLDRARDADRMWDSVAELFRRDRWAFSPEEIAARSPEELGAALQATGASQRHGPDAAAWRQVALSLLDSASPHAVRRAVLDGIGDAPELAHAVREGRWFPLLRGPKISVLWIRMLAAPGGAAISRLDALPVAVDVQVRKVSEYLGVLPNARAERLVPREAVQAAWQSAVAATAGPESIARTSAALDPALWFFGKWGCTFCERAGVQLPIGSACRQCRYARGSR